MNHRSNIRLSIVKYVPIFLVSLLQFTGCSIQKAAMTNITSSLSSEESTVFTGDDDPELIADALPFTLKFYETLVHRDSTNAALLLTTGKLFCLYAQAYIVFPADTLPDSLSAVKKSMGKRAKKLFLRGRDYIFRGLDLNHPGIARKIRKGPIDSAMAITTQADTSYLYWCGAAWLGAITADRSDLAMALSLKRSAALISRVQQLNDNYAMGAAHEILCAYYASLPKSMGGSEQKALEHYAKAVSFSNNKKVSPFVTLATTVDIKNRNRDDFVNQLKTALSIKTDSDPHLRLLNILYQQKARWLLAHTDTFFPEPLVPNPDTSSQK